MVRAPAGSATKQPVEKSKTYIEPLGRRAEGPLPRATSGETPRLRKACGQASCRDKHATLLLLLLSQMASSFN